MTGKNTAPSKAGEPATLLIIPGLGGSGETHWQSLWHKERPDSVQLVQDNWDEPKLDDWLSRLTHAVLRLGKPTVFVAHSLGVALVAHWANQHQNNYIKGALLVAPADVDAARYTPDAVRSFAPMPTVALPFPSIVVASSNDPYVCMDRARYFASQWGSHFVAIGAKGHINAESGLGDWQQGQRLLQQLLERIGNAASSD